MGTTLFVLHTLPLTNLRKQYSLFHRLFADDNRIHDSIHFQYVHAKIFFVETCFYFMKNCIHENKVHLYDDEVEYHLMRSNTYTYALYQAFLTVGDNVVSFLIYI